MLGLSWLDCYSTRSCWRFLVMMRKKEKEKKGGKGSEQDKLLEVAHENIEINGFIYLPVFASC